MPSSVKNSMKCHNGIGISRVEIEGYIAISTPVDLFKLITKLSGCVLRGNMVRLVKVRTC